MPQANSVDDPLEQAFRRNNDQSLTNALLKTEYKRFFGKLRFKKARSNADATLTEQLPAICSKDITRLEQQRQQLLLSTRPLRMFCFPGLLIISLTLAVVAFQSTSPLPTTLLVLLAAWIFIPRQVVKETLLDDYQALDNDYRSTLLPAVLHNFGDIRYQRQGAMALDHLKKQLHFGTSHIQVSQVIRRIEQSDHFYGHYRDCPWVLQQVRFYNHKQQTLFRGHILLVQLPQSFAGTTTLNMFCTAPGASRVHLEKSHFSETTRVESTDQIAARAWLTPAVMERLTHIRTLCPGIMRAHLTGSTLLLLLPGMAFASPLDINTPITHNLADVPLLKEVQQLYLLLDAMLKQFPTRPEQPR
ncbi:DUF3137 domain-containing protein [Alkalimonas sp. NCh-2]|uniref:DUF3137 domain-containing protein n=1 Tax=Alkalimonas sp. NCh-2 TaxID=3144846 RepID=UPI0031F66F84